MGNISYEKQMALVKEEQERNQTLAVFRFYFATRAEQIAPLAGKILESTLQSNFPGIELNALDSQEVSRFLDHVDKNRDGRSMLKGLATVSLIPALRDKEKKEKFVQGMEKFINTLKGKNYTAVFLAVPLNGDAVAIRKHGYEELYSTLSPHSRFSYAYGENISHAVNIFAGIMAAGTLMGEAGFFGALMSGIIPLALGGLLIYAGIRLNQVSHRPYWQINKFIMTGKREKGEGKYIIIGKIFAGYMKVCIKITIWIIKFTFGLILH